MRKTQRLDKVLSHMGFGSRSKIRVQVRNKAVQVNGNMVKDSGFQVDPSVDQIQFNGEMLIYREFVYLMMNKPPGVISATEDNQMETVLDLLPHKYRIFSPFPMGRLDKDTVGLLLLTNDGKRAHDLLSPRKHIGKTYYAEIEGIVDEEDVLSFSGGIRLDDGTATMPAELVILDSSGRTELVPGISRIEVTVFEGKFHQVKRMFLARGKKVIFLKRLSMGPVLLDESLEPGCCRELTDEELDQWTGSRERKE